MLFIQNVSHLALFFKRKLQIGIIQLKKILDSHQIKITNPGKLKFCKKKLIVKKKWYISVYQCGPVVGRDFLTYGYAVWEVGGSNWW